MGATLYYLAYGSNLHPYRLRERVSSSRLAGLVELPGRALRWHLVSGDGSGKCDAPAAGADARVLGALYMLAEEEKPLLDRCEALDWLYEETRIVLRGEGGREREAFLYLALPEHVDAAARPYDWYRDIVLAGARALSLPAAYADAIAAATAIEDPDPERADDNRRRLERMDAFLRREPVPELAWWRAGEVLAP
ncbi:MAG: gamma-glutamylcyclotransferase [Candidatus Krumholzibacteriota bacterium]|nr:gamma-glutamylcyclotransferase [Candidatus Krumholzibacteriota bacterium]